MKVTTLAMTLIASLALTVRGAEPLDMARRADELKNLKWGMFICWSFSTYSGKEWTPGVKDIKLFAAKDCDTDQWARTAKEAGMGYILFLTKHHDGFCLWDTKTTDRRVTKSPLGRDVLAELKRSCEKHGIKLALYFSEGEFKDNATYHPGGYSPEMKKAQLKELLTQYGPIEYIWFDHAQTDGGLAHKETLAWCKSFQLGCFIGYNHGDQEGADIRLGEMGKPGPLADRKTAGPYLRDAPSKNYFLAEFTYPILPKHKGGAMWFYSLPEHDSLCQPAEKLYADYLGAVKYGNIFSIDVGPDFNGKLRAIDVATLRKVGQMIRDHAPEPVIAAEAARPGGTMSRWDVSCPPPLSLNKSATASSVWGSGYEAGRAFDGDETTRWGADKNARAGWIEVDLGRAMHIGRAVIMELGFHRTQEFAIEYKDADTWKALHRGATIAGVGVYDFPPVDARHVRLNILKAGGVPTIEEFQLYPPGAKLPAAIEKAKQEEERRAARVQWFRDAKFGMFITWGLYSVPGGSWQGHALNHRYGEWIEWSLPIPHAQYAAIADTWEPKQFDPDAWVKTAKDAGMKYLLLTAKFHDGFLMYPSKITSYNLYDRSPWRRDPVKALSEACARHGLKFGVYWNHVYDWQNPNALTPDAKASAGRDLDKYIREVSLPQLKELLVDHPLISFIWFDQARGTPEMTYERGKQFADLIHSIRPDIIFNSRLGGYPADYASMGDNGIPGAMPTGVWESPCTINDTWGYKAQDSHFKSAETLIRNLVDVVSKGGNYILNVGPTGNGAIPAPELERLKVMGDWLKVNGESIYGEGRTPFGEELGCFDPMKKDKKGGPIFNAKTEWRSTTGPGKVYIHFFEWPGRKFALAGMKGRVCKAYLLTDRKPLEFTQSDDKFIASLPEKSPDSIVAVLCLELQAK